MLSEFIVSRVCRSIDEILDQLGMMIADFEASAKLC